MPIMHVRVSDGNRQHVLDYIRNGKMNAPYRVIDVGGGVHSWCKDEIDALVDMNIEQNLQDNIKLFRGDINQNTVWDEVLAHVEEHGKFDLCICTHTIEDIRDPVFVCKQMEKISKAGYIAVPSKHIEMARFEFGPLCHRGYIHHRWIYDVQDSKLVGYPKLPVLEHMKDLDVIASTDSQKRDLSFYWKNDIGLSICNDDYMGPDAQSVVRYFYKLIT
jgi:hypothetical protein